MKWLGHKLIVFKVAISSLGRDHKHCVPGNLGLASGEFRIRNAIATITMKAMYQRSADIIARGPSTCDNLPYEP